MKKNLFSLLCATTLFGLLAVLAAAGQKTHKNFGGTAIAAQSFSDSIPKEVQGEVRQVKFCPDNTGDCKEPFLADMRIPHGPTGCICIEFVLTYKGNNVYELKSKGDNVVIPLKNVRASKQFANLFTGRNKQLTLKAAAAQQNKGVLQLQKTNL